MPGETAESQEPTMEEILASIRKIISEDGGENGDQDPAPEPAPDPEPVIDLNQAAPASDPFAEITDAVETSAPEPAPTMEPSPAPEPAAIPDRPEAMSPNGAGPAAAAMHGLVGEQAAMQAAGAFDRLSGANGSGESPTTLEKLVVDLLRPALKEWLDANLPTIVEEQVSRELARIRGLGR